MEKDMKRLTVPALLAAMLLAVLAFTSQDRAAAQSYSLECHPGYNVWHVAGAIDHSAISNIPCDMAKPAWNFDWNSHGRILFVYDGDRVATPQSNDAGRIWTEVRASLPQGNSRPPSNRPFPRDNDPPPVAQSRELPVAESVVTLVDFAEDHQGRVTRTVTKLQPYSYSADANHRAVRGPDGNCFREQRIGGYWQRSGPYGTSDEACRRASYNAYYRSQSLVPLDSTAGVFPSGAPPVARVRQTLASNTAQASVHRGPFSNDLAQAFTTGIHWPGYRVTAIGLHLTVGQADLTDWDVELWSDSDSGSNPGELLATLRKPSTLATGVNTFTVPGSGIDLDANTRYWVVVNNHASNAGWYFRSASTSSYDADPSGGWVIGHISRYRTWISRNGTPPAIVA